MIKKLIKNDFKIYNTQCNPVVNVKVMPFTNAVFYLKSTFVDI